MNVSCPGCQRTLKVSDQAAGKRLRCPHCQTQFRLPSREPVVASQPVAAKATVRPVTPVRKPTRPAGASSTRAVPRTLPKQPATVRAFSGATGAGVSGATRPINRQQKANQNSALAWVKTHKFHVAVASFAILNLCLSLLAPWPMFIVGIFEVVLGAIAVGLLFLPRLHILRKVFGELGSTFVSAAAGLGTTGVLCIAAAVLLKVGLRLNRNGAAENLDFSGLQGGGTAVLMQVAFIFLVGIVLISLWYWIGIARALAATYIAQAAFMAVIVFATVLSAPPIPDASWHDQHVSAEFPGPGGPRGHSHPLPYGHPGNRSAPDMFGSVNPFGVPAEEAVRVLVEFSDGRNAEAIRFNIVSKLKARQWRVRAIDGELVLWVRTNQSFQEVQDAIEDIDQVEVLDSSESDRSFRIRKAT